MKRYLYFNEITRWCFCSILAILIAGCASTDKSKDDHLFFDEWKAKAEKSKGYSPSKPKSQSETISEKPVAVLTPDTVVEVEKPLPTQKVTLKMNDIEVQVLLRALSRAADQNILVSDKVTGKIDINITKAPWDQVFKGILLTEGLTYAWEGDIIRVMTVQDMETELKRESQKRDLRAVEPLETRIVQVSYASAAKLKENLTNFLSLGREGNPIGAVMVDEHTNSIIVQAIRSDIQKIAKVVEKLDRPTSQILIEAHLVETTNDLARSLGIQWGGLFRGTSSGNQYWLGPGVENFGDNSLFDPDTGDPIVFLPPAGPIANFPVDLEDSIGMSLGFLYQNIGDAVLTAQLTALEEKGKLNIISSPSITTVSNQVAFIEAGSRIPTQTVEDGEVNITYIDAVLKLEVTPFVINGNTLKLKIITNEDEPDFTRTVAGNPTIITRRAETTVVVFDGQTTVIGGLNKETASTAEQGIPLLKDIPGLGWLFGNKSKSNQMEEVLIFITPHILKENKSDQNPQPQAQSSQTKDAITENAGKTVQAP
jgi:type IV pilus assembly protein PilQ